MDPATIISLISLVLNAINTIGDELGTGTAKSSMARMSKKATDLRNQIRAAQKVTNKDITALNTILGQLTNQSFNIDGRIKGLLNSKIQDINNQIAANTNTYNTLESAVNAITDIQYGTDNPAGLVGLFVKPSEKSSASIDDIGTKLEETVPGFKYENGGSK